MAAGAVISAGLKQLATKAGGLMIPGLGWLSLGMFTWELLGAITNGLGLTEDSLEKATREATTRQNIEKRKVMGDARTEALGQGFVNKGAPNADRLMEFATMLRSGTFDDVGLPPNENDSLVMHVAQKLGTTPEELAKRTRPRNPSTLLGVDLGVY